MIYELNISELDHKVLSNIIEEPQLWLQQILDSEIAKRRRNLIQLETVKQFANPDITTIQADEDTFLGEIFDATDYKSRAEIISSR